MHPGEAALAGCAAGGYGGGYAELGRPDQLPPAGQVPMNYTVISYTINIHRALLALLRRYHGRRVMEQEQAGAPQIVIGVVLVPRRADAQHPGDQHFFLPHNGWHESVRYQFDHAIAFLSRDAVLLIVNVIEYQAAGRVLADGAAGVDARADESRVNARRVQVHPSGIFPILALNLIPKCAPGAFFIRYDVRENGLPAIRELDNLGNRRRHFIGAVVVGRDDQVRLVRLLPDPVSHERHAQSGRLPEAARGPDQRAHPAFVRLVQRLDPLHAMRRNLVAVDDLVEGGERARVVFGYGRHQLGDPLQMVDFRTRLSFPYLLG